MYAGQPVALVVAESEAVAQDAVDLVEVELEPLDPVLDLEAATRPGAPRARVKERAGGDGSDIGDAHASVSTGVGVDEDLSDNVLDTARLQHGDVDAALANSRRRGPRTFSTPWMYQGYLEPQSAVLVRARRRARPRELDPGAVRDPRLDGRSVRNPDRAAAREDRHLWAARLAAR